MNLGSLKRIQAHKNQYRHTKTKVTKTSALGDGAAKIRSNREVQKVEDNEKKSVELDR